MRNNQMGVVMAKACNLVLMGKATWGRPWARETGSLAGMAVTARLMHMAHLAMVLTMRVITLTVVT
jgi:hypothetical protein